MHRRKSRKLTDRPYMGRFSKKYILKIRNFACVLWSDGATNDFRNLTNQALHFYSCCYIKQFPRPWIFFSYAHAHFFFNNNSYTLTRFSHWLEKKLFFQKCTTCPITQIWWPHKNPTNGAKFRRIFERKMLSEFYPRYGWPYSPFGMSGAIWMK